MITDPLTRLAEELAALDRAYSSGHHGRWSAGRRSDLLDAAIVALFAAADPPPGTALAALGGYGRRQQLPRSDVDLLVVHDGDRPDDVAALVDRLLYPLWDAGLEVGQAVRTPEECAAIVPERLDAATAMLDLRYLAGDEDLAAETAARVRAVVAADADGFVTRLREGAAARADRYGSTAHLLEPELKEGAGGLRDIQTVRWLELVSGGGVPLRDRERATLEAAEEFLTRVRSALHLEAGRRTDRLVLDHQPSIARAMGFTDEPRLIAEDGLMRAVFEHARQVSRILADAFARRAGGATDAAGVPGEPIRGPVGVLDALARTAEAGVPASPQLLDEIEAADVPDPVAWSPEVRDAFLGLLRAGEPAAQALDTLDRLGLLARFLPAWAAVRCRPQRDPYHRYTVDTHLTSALTGMSSMLAAPDPDDPVERDAVEETTDPDALRLGALLHDIGKTGEGGHVPIGTRIADETLASMGLPDPTRELASFMVAHHLLLPDTATRRDLTDEDLILSVAATIATTERLGALYLLAKADAAATGPAAWTPWRRALVRELVTKVRRVFDRGDMGAELAEQLTDRIGRLRDLLDAEPDDEVERFVLRMPRGYFLSVEPGRAARHYGTIAPDIGRHDVRTAAADGSRPGTYELLVVAADRPGLLSWIAGALAVAGLSILSAQVFTTVDGVAVDLFEVEGVFEPDVGERRWREFRRTLRGAIEGAISLDRRVEDKRRHYPRPDRGVPVTIAVENDASDFSTVIEVGAPDRLGLLYDITSTLADLRLDVYVAKVATYTGRVIDAFYVRDAVGGKVTDPAQVAEIETAVRARLGG
ncbi:MAG: [protein-PII] uridylyltransferase family protein [Actinomycetota bacterium]